MPFFAGVGDQLAKVFVSVGDQNVNHIAGIGVGTKLRDGFGEIGVSHGVDRLPGEFPGLVEFLDDLGRVGGGFFIRLAVETGWGLRSHQGHNLVTLGRNMQKDFGERTGIGRGAPVEFVGGECVSEVDEFFLPGLEVEKGLGFHVVAGGSVVGGGGGLVDGKGCS